MESKKERINEVFTYLRIQKKVKTQKDFAEIMKTYPANISRILAGNEEYLTDNFLLRVNEEFDNVFNERWLLTGEGEMLNGNTSDNNTIKDRIKSYIVYKEISQREFERCIKKSNGYVNNIVNTISADVLNDISKEFDDLNINWLITGEGEMLKGGFSSTSCIDLKRFREEFRLKQTDLMSLLGVSQGFISRVENGRELFPDKYYKLLLKEYTKEDLAPYIIEISKEGCFSSNINGSSAKCLRLKQSIGELIKRGYIDVNKIQKDISDRMGANYNSVNYAISGNDKYLTNSFIKRYNDTFDSIFNEDWLLVGEGDMLKESQGSTTNDRLLDLIESQQRTIENLSQMLKQLMEK